MPELRLTAMVHSAGPVFGPGIQATYEPALADEEWDHHWAMAALQIKDPMVPGQIGVSADGYGHRCTRLRTSTQTAARSLASMSPEKLSLIQCSINGLRGLRDPCWPTRASPGRHGDPVRVRAGLYT
jgi:hypothetical protein